MAHEARQGEPFRRALLQVMEAIEHPTRVQREWMEQLRGIGTGDRTVNFSGLTSDEIRAQCALITQSVHDHLPGPERFAIWARYAYQAQKGAGIQGLASYIRPQLSIGDEIAICALLYGHVMPNQREKGFSYPEISKDRGIPVITLRRSAAIIGQTARTLEQIAIERLTPMFEGHGVVEIPDKSMYA